MATNANDQLSNHKATSGYYPYTSGLHITSGARHFAEDNGAYWFLDIIASYQQTLHKRQLDEFQVWKITKNKTGSGARVSCEDGNEHELLHQRIKFTDFPHDEGTLWCANGVIYLPSEH